VCVDCACGGVRTRGCGVRHVKWVKRIWRARYRLRLNQVDPMRVNRIALQCTSSVYIVHTIHKLVCTCCIAHMPAHTHAHAAKWRVFVMHALLPSRANGCAWCVTASTVSACFCGGGHRQSMIVCRRAHRASRPLHARLAHISTAWWGIWVGRGSRGGGGGAGGRNGGGMAKSMVNKPVPTRWRRGEPRRRP
jgi:hypothetical protein